MMLSLVCNWRVFILVMFLASPVWATQRFATPTGSGSACTIGSPCSVRTCVEATFAGDQCYLRSGTYNVSIRTSDMTIHSGTSDANRVIIAGYPSDPPLSVILRPTSGAPIAVEWNQSTAYVTFENMVLDAAVSNSDALHTQGPNVHHIRWKDLEVKNAMGMGPSCSLGGPEVCPGMQGISGHSEGSGGHHQEFLNLKVHHNGFNRVSHNVYLACEDCVIDGGEYYDSEGYGLQIYNGNCSSSGVKCNNRFIVRNVRIYNNRGDGAVTLNNGDNILFYNNLVYNNPTNGLSSICYQSPNNTQVYNNVFYGNGGSAVDICGGGSTNATNTQVKNNIFMNNGGVVGGANANSGGTVHASNLCFNSGSNTTGCTHVGDPKFVAPGSDFTLQADSAAINIGATLSAVTTDKAGTARPQPPGGMYDVGAYERVGTGGGPGPGPDPCPPNCPVTCPPDCPVEPPPAVKAFPSAEGFGATAVGGRGTSSQPGRTIEVTRLADDTNPGSLRYCVEQTGPRTCVFRTGGTIALNSPLKISGPNIGQDRSFLTIAGQTAPGGGIQLKNWYVEISYGAHDVIIRHLKVRPGTDHLPTSINNQCGGIVLYRGEGTVHHVILDHVSIEWSCDDSLNVSGLIQDTTIQWSLIGEGMNSSDYCSATPPNECANSKGFLVGDFVDQTVTFHHNMMLDIESRIPAVVGSNPIDFRNNLVYNWYACTAVASFGNQPAGFTRANFVGNKYLFGPNANSFSCAVGQLDYEALDMYAIDNSTPWCERDGNCSTASFAQMGFLGPDRLANPPVNELQARVSTPFTVPAVTTTPVANLEALLTSKVGAIVPARDSLDTRLINEMTSRTGTRGRNGDPWPTLALGTAPTDTDHDGMPDTWEDAHSLNKNEPGDAAQITSTGYSNLENYLNTLAGDTVNLGPPTGNRVSPGVFYVALNGVDPPTRGCTEALNDINAPLLSFDAGRSCSTVAGDKLFLRQGSHTTGLTTATQPITNGTSWDNATTIGSYGTETATLVLASASNVALYFNSNNQYIILDRLIVDCHNQAESNGLAMTPGTHHIRFQNGEVKNCHYEPIYIENSDNNEVLNSTIHGSVVASCINLTGGSDNTKVHNNTIYGCPEAGIEAASPNTNTSIRSNVIHDVGSASNLAGIALTGAATPEIINNVAYANYRGVQLLTGTSNAKVYNNTLHGNTQQGLLVDSGVTGTTATNNIVAANTSAQIIPGTGTTQTTNLTVAPPFDATAPNKFHLTAASTTAVNQGTTLTTDVPTDYEGVPRPQGGFYDIGASEFIGTLIPPPPGAIQGPYWRGQGFLWR